MMIEGVRSVAITSANPGEGVTSVAVALAQRHLLAGRSTLLVDLDLHSPSFSRLLELNVPRVSGPLDAPQLIGVTGKSATLTGITAPKRPEAIIKLRNKSVLEQSIALWLQSFDSVIFDTSPVNCSTAHSIPPERVAAACDGSLLVVLAGQTTETMVVTAVNRLKANEARVLGCLFNDRDNPSLQSELLRIARYTWPFRGWLSRKIQRSRLLSLEV